MQIRMNVQSAAIALALSACTSTESSKGPLAAALHDAPATLAIQPGTLALTVTNLKGVVLPDVAPTVRGGTIVIDSIDDRVRVLDLDIELSDVELSADAVGLADGLSFVDMHVGITEPFDAHTTWSADQATASSAMTRLELRWALGTDRGPSPLANQLVTTEVKMTLAGDDDAVDASIRITSFGSFWHFGQLTLSDLRIDLGASQR
jgi:hypothetical protein